MLMIDSRLTTLLLLADAFPADASLVMKTLVPLSEETAAMNVLLSAISFNVI